MLTTADDIIACARSWVGTRFHHQGRLKKTAAHGGGVDCLGLLAGIAAELDLCAADGTPLTFFDRADYGHLPDGRALRAGLAVLLAEVNVDDLQPGDIALIAIDGVARHLGVVGKSCGPLCGIAGSCDPASGEPQDYTLIHAYAQARKVVEHALDAWWRQRIVAVYRLC